MKINLLLIVFIFVLCGCASCGKVYQKKDTQGQLSAESYFNKGWYYENKGYENQAIEEYTKAIEVNPKYILAYSCRSRLLTKKGEYERALSDVNTILKIDSKSAAGYFGRGNIYSSQGHYEKAIDDYNRAIEIDPLDPYKKAIIYSIRGRVFYEKGDYQQAIADYTKALEIDPIKYVDLYKRRAQLWFNKGEHDCALNDINKYLIHKPNDAKMYSAKGVIWFKKGLYDRALEDITYSLELNPYLPDAYNAKAWMLATCPDETYRDGSKAVELARKAMEIDSVQYTTYLDTLAAAYAELGKFKEARQTQELAISKIVSQENANKERLDEFNQHLRSYKDNKPWRDIIKKSSGCL